MRDSRPPLYLILFFVVLPSLAVFGRSGGWWGSTSFALVSGPEEAAELRQIAAEFDAERYADARALLDSYAGPHGRGFEFYRRATDRRLAALAAQEEEARAATLELLQFVQAEDDRWSALAVTQLLRPFDPEHSGALERLVRRAAAYWQASVALERDAPHYADLFEALIQPSIPFHAELLDMWVDLERSPLPRERLRSLGQAVLDQSGRPGGVRPMPRPYTPPRRLYTRVDDADALRMRVATDLLAQEPEGWLRAICHAALGDVHHSRAEHREAVAQFRAAIEAETPENSGAARWADERLRRIVEPLLVLQSPMVYQPNSLHQLSLRWRNLRAWKLSVTAIDPHSLEPQEDPSTHAWRGLKSEDAGRAVYGVSEADEKEVEAREPGARTQPHVPKERDLWLDPLPPGLYRAELTGEGFVDGQEIAVARQFFLVTEMGVRVQSVGSPGHEELELWVLNMRSGEPIAGTTLKLRSGPTARRQPLRLTESVAQTDANGILRIPLPGKPTGALFATGDVDGHPIVVTQGHIGGNLALQNPNDTAYVVTDRPLYRPGETVQLQAFLRTRIPARRAVELPAGHDTAWLFVHASDGSELLRRELTLDANGAIECDFALPVSTPLGRYGLQIRWEESGRSFGAGSIQVDEVRLPEFRLRSTTLSGDKPVLGDTVRMELRAEYLFGGAVSGSGEYVVRRGQLSQPFPSLSRIAPIPPHIGGSEEFARGSFDLDDAGRAEIEFLADPRSPESMGAQFSVEFRVTDSSRREVRSESYLQVGRTEFRAGLRPSRWVVAPGDRVRVAIELATFDSEPVDARVHMRAVRTVEDEEIEIDDSTVEVKEGRGVYEFEAGDPGQIRVELATTDSRGTAVESSTQLWCADPKKAAVVEGEGGLTLVAEKDSFEGRGPARVLLFSSYPNAAVRVVRAHAGGLISEIVRLKGSMKLLEVPLDELHRPSFELRASTAHDFRVWTSSIVVQTPPVERRLRLSLEFDRESHGPGEEARLRVKAMDAEGKPAAGPVTVSVIDASVLEVVPREISDPYGQLYSFGRVRIPAPFDFVQGVGGFRFFDEKSWEGVRIWDRLEPGVRYALNRDAIDIPPPPEELPRPQVPMEAAPDAQTEMMTGKMAAEGGFVSATDVEVRRDFRTTALWRTAVLPDADGTAEIRFALPETLGEWNALALSIDGESRAGMAETTTRTYKPVQLRLNHPRVFRERDRVMFTGSIHNDGDEDLVCTVSLRADPLVVEGASRDVIVAAQSVGQVAWWAEVPDGSAKLELERDAESGRLTVWPDRCLLRAELRSSAGDDAFERSVDLIPHGTPLDVSASAELRETGSLVLELPGERVRGGERATLTLAPSVLSTCFEVLPYLADYPYGCTEQTLSRFVPAAAVRHVARQFGKSASSIDPALDDKLRASLRRIADSQHGDGGWGWWKEGSTDPYMTSYVLVALAEAEGSGVDVDPSMLRRGRQALRALLSSLEERPSDMAYALFALAMADGAVASGLEADETMARYAGWLFERRAELTDYSRALLAVYLHRSGESAQANDILAFLRNTMQADDEYATRHWGKRSGFWHRSEGAVETTSFVLRALLEIQPEDESIRPAARWLVQNRRAGRWDNTRVSAHAIYALCDYASAKEDFATSYLLRASIGDVQIAEMAVDPDDIFDLDTVHLFDPSLLTGGRAEIRIEMEGEGVCYASAHLSTYSQSDDPDPTANWISLTREIVRLVPTPTLGGEYRQVEAPLEAGAPLRSGERLRVRLHLNAHSDLEYLAIEDPRPAGAEPTDALSGWFSSHGVGGRLEIRDEKTGFFVRALTEGEHVIEYDLRVESPGSYHALPALAYSMYVPDISGSSTARVLVFGEEE